MKMLLPKVFFASRSVVIEWHDNNKNSLSKKRREEETKRNRAEFTFWLILAMSMHDDFLHFEGT